MSRDARAAAATAIGAVLSGRSLARALPAALQGVAPADRPLVQQLCYGTLRDYPRLRAVLDQLLQKPLKSRDNDIQGLLLAGLYQLEHSRVPPHAAVAETVDASARLGKGWSRGLVNAVLRRFQRERAVLLERLSDAAASAHPQWYRERLLRDWPEQAAAVLQSNNSPPPMTLRVNPRRQSRARYLERLAAAGIAARPGSLSEQALRLEQPVDVLRLPGFDQGCASVQDEAAQLAAPLLRARPGEAVLDACAAPGGKTCHILETLDGAPARMVALDSDAERQGRTRDNLSRLALRAELVTGDAARPPPPLRDCLFDRVLVDAPCSASGVLRRHPDIKVLRRPADIAALAATQLAILRGLWPLLRPGGTLLYVTCSVFREENDTVIQRFLALAGNALNPPLEAAWGEPTQTGRQVLPGLYDSDGLFFCRLEKAA